MTLEAGRRSARTNGHCTDRFRSERMTRVLGLLSLLLAAGLCLAPAGAGDEKDKKAKGDVDALFKRLDADKDGRLSKDEFLRMAERFKERDKARKELGAAFDKL